MSQSEASSVAPPIVKEADRNVKTEYKNAEYDTFKLESKEAMLRPGESPVMRVFPPVVEFHGVEVGTLYVITITIQNTSNTVRRVRFIPPKTQFTLRNEPKGGLAPGLDVSADIDFLLKRSRIFMTS